MQGWDEISIEIYIEIKSVYENECKLLSNRIYIGKRMTSDLIPDVIERGL